jgi:hypothetical protein
MPSAMTSFLTISPGGRPLFQMSSMGSVASTQLAPCSAAAAAPATTARRLDHSHAATVRSRSVGVHGFGTYTSGRIRW